MSKIKKLLEDFNQILNEEKDNKIKIFLSNLGKYNEGELVGEWITLPVDDFKPYLDKIGINDQYEEFFISDFDAPFDIGEYDNIEELNQLARDIADFDEHQQMVFEVISSVLLDGREAAEIVANSDYLYLEGDLEHVSDDDERLGYALIDMNGLPPIRDEKNKNKYTYYMDDYFDYESFGHDNMVNGQFIALDNGDFIQFDS
jgi:hypothetical protein